MSCQKCYNDRIFEVAGKSSDLNNFSFKGKEDDGYLPTVKGICGGDYFDMKICLECGQVQGSFPLPDPKIGDDEDYE